VVLPEAGDYRVIDDGAGSDSTINEQAKSRKFLGRVNVGVGQAVKPDDIKAYLQKELIAAADRTMPETVKKKVHDDLVNDLRLTSFVPHPDIADSEVTGKQTLQFKIDNSGGLKFEVDGNPYKPDRIDRTLTLGGVDEWTLTSWNNPPVNHPFHIHVNPFQVVKILDPNGNDVSLNGESDDPQYANLKGIWKDTLLVKANYQIIIRTRYQRYIGEFVLHCHILDHEDQGMMQNIRIAIPDGSGGVTEAHH
jgi:L-ascorbate oxidase